MVKNLVLFCESVFPTNNAGSVRAYYFLEALVQRKLFSSIIVITATRNPQKMHGVVFYSVNIEKVYTNNGFIKRATKEFWLGVKTISVMMSLEKSENVFFISSPTYLGGLVITLFLKVTKRKYILEIRDLYPEAYSYAGLLSSSGLIYKVFRRLTNSVYDSSELIVSATDGLMQQIRLYTDVDIVNIYNGFPALLSTKACQKFSKFTVVFHGTMGVFQNIELICDVAEKLENDFTIDFLIIGQGSKAGLISDYISSHNNMRFVDSLSHKEVLDLVSKCHIGLSLRLDDPLTEISFPVKNWEYLGLSIPTIISPRKSEAARFVSDNNCGIAVDNDRLDIIVKFLAEIKADSSMYQNMVESCNKVNKDYSREGLSNKLVDELVPIINKQS